MWYTDQDKKFWASFKEHFKACKTIPGLQLDKLMFAKLCRFCYVTCSNAHDFPHESVKFRFVRVFDYDCLKKFT